MIAIEVDDAAVIAALTRLRDRVGEAGLRPALSAIGELLTESTKQRFATGTAPDGSRWPANARGTLERLLAKTRGVAVGTNRFAKSWEVGEAMIEVRSSPIR